MEQILMMIVMLVLTAGMSYLMGDIHGYMRCLKETHPLNSDKE